MTDTTPNLPAVIVPTAAALPLNPIETVDPEALTRLFVVDPATLSGRDFDSLIHELRRRASSHLAEKAAADLAPKTAKPRTKKLPSTPALAVLADKPVAELNIDDLFSE
ncbi:hypothetical protein Kuura_036 [Caulobacter phage Kuura]|nr:hypothetical protein Kuura_036 [Caulobacter phage Kuura]